MPAMSFEQIPSSRTESVPFEGNASVSLAGEWKAAGTHAKVGGGESRAGNELKLYTKTPS